jgi:hypothetical protein
MQKHRIFKFLRDWNHCCRGICSNTVDLLQSEGGSLAVNLADTLPAWWRVKNRGGILSCGGVVVVCPSIGGTTILGERACVAMRFPRDPIEITDREVMYVHTTSDCVVVVVKASTVMVMRSHCVQ